MNKPTFAASADSILVSKKLIALKPGEGFSYNDLNAMVPGRDLRVKHRYILETARKLALKDSGIVTGCVSGKGIKRLDNEEILDIAESTISHIRRASKKASYKTIQANYDQLSEDGKQRFNTGLSVLGAIVQFTSTKALNAINGAVGSAKNRLPIEQTAALFLKNSQ